MKNNKTLELGKISQEALNSFVFPHIKLYKKPMLDANIIKQDTAISHNLAIGVPLSTLGFFAFHYAASNIAVCFARPIYIVTGIYLPPGSTERDLESIAIGLGEETEKYRVKIVAGHTGVYKGLSAALVSVTCIGRVLRKPEKLSVKDLILIAGDIGKEAIWLKTLKKGYKYRNIGITRKLTPLPLANALMRLKDVKLMHDISEGGVAGALYEVSKNVSLKLRVQSSPIPFYDGSKDLGEDPLKIPSYGALIIIASEKGLDKIFHTAKELDYPCAVIGNLDNGKGILIDGNRIERIKRTQIDEIYGSIKNVL